MKYKSEKVSAFRYLLFILILAAAFSTVAYARGVHVRTEEVRVFFTDAEMLRLMPVKINIPKGSPQSMAKRVISELIEGRDSNPKIRRLIPNSKNCMTVKVKDSVAYVDIKKAMLDEHPDGRDLEILTVYSIVNSLTEIDGIKTVRFTIGGRVQKNFMGYLDMRETFVPDYFV